MANYDYTNAERKRVLRSRKNKAYTIIKIIAKRLGYMNGPSDVEGLDRFLDEYTTKERQEYMITMMNKYYVPVEEREDDHPYTQYFGREEIPLTASTRRVLIEIAPPGEDAVPYTIMVVGNDDGTVDVVMNDCVIPSAANGLKDQVCRIEANLMILDGVLWRANVVNV